MSVERPSEDSSLPEEVEVFIQKSQKDTTLKSGEDKKKIKTVALYGVFISVGCCASLLGPSLLDLEILFGLDKKTVSLAITVGSIGYLCGSGLVAMIYDRFNVPLQFSLALVVMALTTALMPYMPLFSLFNVLYALASVAMGFCDAAGPPYLSYLWSDSKYKNSLLQGFFGIWSVGTTIAPVLIHPFLSSTPSNTTSYQDLTTSNETSTEMANTTFHLLTNKEDIIIHYGFILIGLLITLFGILFILVFLLDGPSCHSKLIINNEGENSKPTSISFRNNVILLTLLSLFYFLYVGPELSLYSFLASFVIKCLHLERVKGSLMTSALYGAVGIGRLVGVPVAWYLKPSHMLIINFSLSISSMCVLLFSSSLHEAVIWCVVICSGLGMSTVFASGVAWVSSITPYTGLMSGVVIMSGSVGAMVIPALTGFLFQSFSPMCLIYVVLAGFSLLALVFVVMEIFASKCLRVVESQSEEGEVISPEPS